MQDKINNNDYLKIMKDRYERVFSTDDGRKVLEDIIICGRLKKSCFSTDALTMAFNEGKRDLAQNIFDLAQPDESNKPRQNKAKQ